MSNLDTHWRTRPLGDICKIVGGGTPSKKNEAFYQGDIPWATVRDMNQDIITDTSFRITEDAVKNSSTNIIEAGNVIIATRVGLGKVCLLKQDTAINQDLRAVIPKKDDTVSTLFLFWWLKSIAHVIEQEGTGATVKGVKLPFVKSLPLPLPPLHEQHRIVSILDEVFEGIGKATANVERNLENSRELFESHLRILFSEQQKGWFETTVGEQATLQRGFDITKKNQNPGGVPVVSSGGIKSYHDTAKVDGPGVVIGRKGSLGTVHYVEKNYWPHDTTLWVKDFHENDPRLVYYFFKQLDVKSLDTGTANPALNRNHVHPIKVLWPETSEQPKVVSILNIVSDKTQQLEAIYRQKLNALEELRQSILQKAFTGELTSKTVDKLMEPV